MNKADEILCKHLGLKDEEELNRYLDKEIENEM